MGSRNITRKTKLNLSEQDIEIIYDNNLTHLLVAHNNVTISLDNTQQALEHITKALNDYLTRIKKTKRTSSKQNKSVKKSISKVSNAKRSI